MGLRRLTVQSWTIGVLAALLFASSAPAAPTCRDRAGETVRCGTAGAMPVGWTPAGGERLGGEGLSPEVLAALIYVVGGIFAIIALMPRFDGRWDRQESDDETDG